MQKILKIEWIQMNSSIKKELPQFLSDQKLENIFWKFKCMKEITIQAQKIPKKCCHYILPNETYTTLSL